MNYKKSITVLIVEDHDCVSLGVKQLLLSDNDFDFQITTTSSADQAYTFIKKYLFDIVLLDIVLKNPSKEALFFDGDDLLRQLNKDGNNVKIIVLSKVDSLDMLDYIINILGADGYILKSRSSLNEIIPAINSVLDGENYFSNSIKKALKHNEMLIEIDFIDRLILKKLSQGLTQPQIEIELLKKSISLTVSAIEKRIRRLKLRFDAKTTSHLIALSIQNGII